MSARRAVLRGVALALLVATGACDTTLTSGVYGCAVGDPGGCPAGWVCERRDGIGPRCYAEVGLYCGDGVASGQEVCDGAALGGASCQLFGYDQGTVRCCDDCAGFDTSGCDGCTLASCPVETCPAPACGDGIADGKETDVDCGGDCRPCPAGARCLGDADCAGRACEGGVCARPGPVVLAATPNAMGLAVDATSVYFTGFNQNGGDVLRVGKDGGPVTLIANGEGGAQSVAVDEASVYWIDNGRGWNGTLRAAPIGGGAPVTLSAPARPLHMLLLDGPWIYYSEGNTEAGQGQIHRIARQGGADTILTTRGGNLHGLAKSGTTLVAVDYSNTGKAIAVSSDGGVWHALSTGDALPVYVVADANAAYFADTDPNDGRVRRKPLDDNPATTLAQFEDSPVGIAVDESWVYVSLQVSGEIVKIPIQGGAPIVLATGQALPQKLVIDDGFIYWTNYGSGQIMKLAK